MTLLTLTISATLMSCGSSVYTPSKYFSKWTYRDYQKNNFWGLGSTPGEGDAKLLVIPVWFTDSSTYIFESKKEGVRDDIRKAFFGTDEEMDWYSVATYYEQDSFGKVHISGEISDWYEVGKPASDYYSSDSDMGGLLFSALDWYKETTGKTTLDDFDADADGLLDGVAFIYAYPDSSNLQGINAPNLWGYTSWASGTRNPKNPGLSNFFWASYDFMYDKQTAIERAGTQPHRGDNTNNNVDAHCYIHEWGHNFGLPDYYDYDYTNSFAGGFSMQDSNVGAHDPFSRYALGWADAYIPTKSCTINLKSMETSGEMIILAPSFTDSCFDEYVILEYYTPTGLNELDTYHQYLGRYPTGLDRAGIRIWHVDARLLRHNAFGQYKETTTDASKPYLYTATNNNTTNDYCLNENYHTLTLLRNDPSASYEYGFDANADDLFYEGDTFSFTEFANQFPEHFKLNNNKSFTWKVTIESISEDSAKIKLTK